MNDLKVVIFDWDGTLVDSQERIVTCLRESARDIGLPVLGDEVYADIIGLGLYEAIERLYPGMTEPTISAYRDGYARQFVQFEREPSGFFDGALDVLTELRNRGHLLAVATGKSRRGLDRTLRSLGLETFFDATRCADETASKPNPQMLYEIVEQLSCNADQAVMIGDTEYDLEMATRAGTHSIGVSHGVHHPERLQRHAPRHIVDSLHELLDVIA